MGASIVYGNSFEKKEVAGLCVDTLPINGGYEHFSYSNVAAMKRYAQSLGVEPDAWPDFCNLGITANLVPLDEVYDRNQRIREEFARLRPEDAAANSELAFVCKLVQAGKQFFIV